MKLLITLLLFIYQPDSTVVQPAQQEQVQAVEPHQDIVEATKLRWNLFRSYFYHLAKTPDEITAIIKWTVCTLFVWFMLFRYRERAIKGMEGTNLFWEGGEQVTYFTFYAFFPILFHIGFFEKTAEHSMVALYITSGIMVYQVTGRCLFDWALAFRTGKSTVTETGTYLKEEKTQVTETTTKQ